MDKILSAWKNKDFKPVYWFQGEEDYYIDRLLQFAERNILSEAEAEFNLSVFYGKDAQWQDIINSCRRYPIFSERQVVLLKEAQEMDVRKLEQLTPCFLHPLNSTVFIVGYKDKGLDKRTKFAKVIAENAAMFTFPKIKDNKVQEWIMTRAKEKKIEITPKAVCLLEEHIGNDLSRLDNELGKLIINLKQGKAIDEDDIEKYIGISKEYNVFALQEAISNKQLAKAMAILNYFGSNPKLVSIQMALPALYAHFGKVYGAFGLKDHTASTLMPEFYYNPLSVQQAQQTIMNYGFEGVSKIILLLNKYNLRSVGIDDAGTSSAALLKELVTKIILT